MVGKSQGLCQKESKRRSTRPHKPNPRYIDTIVKEIGNTMNYLSELPFMKAKKTVNTEHV